MESLYEFNPLDYELGFHHLIEKIIQKKNKSIKKIENKIQNVYYNDYSSKRKNIIRIEKI